MRANKARSQEAHDAGGVWSLPQAQETHMATVGEDQGWGTTDLGGGGAPCTSRKGLV